MTEWQKERMEYLRLVVPAMRELGVSSFDGVVLDPAFEPAPMKGHKRSDSRQRIIDNQWRAYRIAVANAEIDGTILPDPPTEPERDPNE
jgi:hypothetical protein